MGLRRPAWIALAIIIAAAWALARRPAARPEKGMPLKLRLPPNQDVQLAVYFAAGKAGVPSSDDLLAAARSWVAAHTKDPLRASIERHLGEGLVKLGVLERDELPLPFDGVFDALPDPARARKRFADAGHAVHVRSRGPLAPPFVALWAAVGAARGIARATGGLVYDPEAFRFARDGSLTEDLPANGGIVAVDHIVVPYSSGKDGLAWVTTVGLAKFGLPNLECREVPPDIAEEIGAVLNAVAQHLVAAVLARPAASTRELVLEDEITIEEAVFLAANGRGAEKRGTGAVARVRVTFTPERPDGTGPFLTLLPPRGSSVGKGVWLHEIVTTLESRADPVVPRPADDPALAKARKEARSHLPRVKGRFVAGLAPGETLYVKHAFTGEGGIVEHMWVAVTSWEGEKVEGTLANDPRDIPSLRAGQTVEIDETGVDDWMISGAGGTREGGFSAEVLRADDGKSR